MNANPRLNVFFYGLFMEADVLRAHGVSPRDERVACVHDHVVRLGAKAMLLPAAAQRGWGVLHALTRPEVDALYAKVPGYREVAFTAHLKNGDAVPAISMVHTRPPLGSAEDPAYATQWKAIVQRLKLPLAGGT